MPLRFTLANRGHRPVHVLEWGTPLEAWLSSYLEVRRDGQTLEYQGAKVKRGDPGPEEYRLIPAGRRLQVVVDLAEAYAMERAGRYEVQPKLVLHDAYVGSEPRSRPRSAHRSLALACPVFAFTLES